MSGSLEVAFNASMHNVVSNQAQMSAEVRPGVLKQLALEGTDEKPDFTHLICFCTECERHVSVKRAGCRPEMTFMVDVVLFGRATRATK